jgi:hypothetical protein
MTLRVVDYKQVDMEDEEFEYYKKLTKSFDYGHYQGTEMFHDVFEVEGDGCIAFINPPIGKQVAWSVLFFLQNLMINQRLRRIERKFDAKNSNS